jgi:hypothetical protein
MVDASVDSATGGLGLPLPERPGRRTRLWEAGLRAGAGVGGYFNGGTTGFARGAPSPDVSLFLHLFLRGHGDG